MNLMRRLFLCNPGSDVCRRPPWAAEVVKLPPPRSPRRDVGGRGPEGPRTVRQFAARSLDLKQVSQLLWGADGVSDSQGHRTRASAGATYPLEIYLVVARAHRGGPDGRVQLPLLVKEHALELAGKATGAPRWPGPPTTGPG